MRVLIAHNRYRPTAPSGENAVVDQEAELLATAGHVVRLFQRHSAEISDWSTIRRAALPAQVLWSGASKRSLSEELRAFRPDVVHVHNTFPLMSPSILYACRDESIPVVATTHNYRHACANGEFYRSGRICHDCVEKSSVAALRHGCYRESHLSTIPVVLGTRIHREAWRSLVSAHIFISGAQRELLSSVGIPAERSFVKHNFVPRPPLERAQPLHQIAFVGRIDHAKGAGFLMSAWDAFIGRNPTSSLQLVIAGSGSLSGEVSSWAATRSRVSMLGRLSRDDASALMARSRAVVVPSQWEETFGLVAVEAMARGTAVIAAGHGALPEIVTTGVDGALFRPGDAESLVRILAELDRHPTVWDKYGDDAHQSYLSRFTPEANLESLLAVYEFAINNPVSSPPPPKAPERPGRLDPKVG
jgi:glycosyltransferase involved in cell wall biosynthesis